MGDDEVGRGWGRGFGVGLVVGERGVWMVRVGFLEWEGVGVVGGGG